jgi:hypothetical protein
MQWRGRRRKSEIQRDAQEAAPEEDGVGLLEEWQRHASVHDHVDAIRAVRVAGTRRMLARPMPHGTERRSVGELRGGRWL